MSNQKLKLLTLEERKAIQKGLDEGLSGSKIARSLGRSVNASSTEVRKNGGRLYYSAEKAEQSCKKRWFEKYKTLSEKAKKNKTPYFMKQRLENLEMQVQILHDAIKELMNR